MKVTVVGLGYIGLPTALMMAANGVQIVGVDKKEELLETLRAGKLTFSEKGLDTLFQEVLASGNLTLADACDESDIYIVTVPTPYQKRSKKIDARYVIGAIQDILKVCPKNAVIAIESTISPGTIDRYVRPAIKEAGFTCGKDIHIAHVPERIIPGNMLYELEHNNLTIGVDEPEVGETLRQVYQSFCKGDMIITSIKVAEMTKVVENTFRDINIAFANELCRICSSDGIDVNEVIKVANMHPRVNILSPGPGVGGHCISVDPWFLIGDYPDIVNIIKAAREVNDSMPEYVLSRVSQLMKEYGIKDASKVGFYGLTYKENVDDVRESPTLQLLEHMEEHLAYQCKVFDPYVNKRIVEQQMFDFDAFLNACDIIVVMVAHQQILEQEEKLQNKIVLDTHNCLKNTEAHLL